MERIGLLTIHDTLNFGSMLQTHALYQAVNSLGYDIRLIDYKNKAIQQRESSWGLTDCRGIKDLVKHFLLHPFLKRKQRYFRQFALDVFEKTEAYDENTIAAANAQFDTFLVGSDIVWGMKITGHDYQYFLKFAEKGKRKLAFSSSVGEKWDDADAREIAVLLRSFQQISVRERQAAEWIRELIGRTATVTCDPTMLWTVEFWREFSRRAPFEKRQYVLVYFTTEDRRTVKDAVRYGKAHRLPVYFVRYKFFEPGVKNLQVTRIEDWVSLIEHAHTVFTASYHGLLFSLYFHKKVFWYNRENRTRMVSLAKELGIGNWEGTERNIRRDGEINYRRIDQIMEKKREDSWKCLKKMLIK